MNIKTYILLVLLILPVAIFGQFSFLDDPYGDIEVSFLKKKIETKPEEAFFNVVKIVNPTDRRLQFNANISLPKDWSLMIEDRRTITLNPKDSILIPIRGGISKKAKGDVGYAVVASLTTNKGKSFKNEYSFVNVPKISEIQVKPEKRSYYINNSTNEATLQVNCFNKGNVDEVIYFEFDYDQGIKIENGAQEKYSTEILLPTNTDTTISLNVEYLAQKRKELSGRRFYRIHMKSYTRDTTIQDAMWVKKVDQNYENYIPDRNRLLIVELSALNIFSEYDPLYNGTVKGSFLTRKMGSIFYRYQTLGDKFTEDPWKYSRIYTEYNNKFLKLKLGDIGESIDQSLYGRGGAMNINLWNQELEVIATKNLFSSNTQAGSLLKIKPSQKYGFELGGIYAENPNQGKNNYTGVLGFNINSIRHTRFYVRGGYSETRYPGSAVRHDGYGITSNLSVRYKKFDFNTNFKFGDRLYEGYFAGILRSQSHIRYEFSNKLTISSNLNIYKNNPPYFEDDNTLAKSLYFDMISSTNYLNYHYNPTFTFYAGPKFLQQTSNNFYNFSSDSELKVPTGYLTGGLKIRSQQSPIRANIRVSGGLSYIEPDLFAISTQRANEYLVYPSMEISANIQGRFWSVFATYRDGPYTLNKHFQKVYYFYETRTLNILPQLDIFIFKDYLKLSNRSTLSFDMSARTSRYNIGTELTAYPGKGWRIKLLNTYSHQSTFDDLVDEKDTYSSSYFEFRVQKKFGFDQPRIQYHDLTIVFFKDLNGDGQKGNDEPGIQNVLAKIDVDQDVNDSLEQISMGDGGFYAVELLSDLKGIVNYENIPGGFYVVKHVPLGNMQGNFTSDETTTRIVMDDDKTVYIPFKENNKIFGSVILNRSKLSNLGTISPANVKITATDSKNNVYSTLTDKNGDFVLYVPNVDKYTVHMNNIFYEQFNLVQNDYTVELNGYRQFEINFILNEKRRRINFSNSLDMADQQRDVRVLRRTNLGGSVKDAATFKPIKAEVKIIDNETGEIVTETQTDGKTGKFYVTYLAGKNYKLVVTSDGYWFYSENLPTAQITTFQNIKREIMLDYITVGSKVNLQSITFEPDSDNLTPESMAELDRLAGILKDNPGIELEIVGHCDDIEALENIEIAEDRARTVMSYLMKQGIKNLKFSSAGNSQPVSTGNTEEERAKNRRVEAIVISK